MKKKEEPGLTTRLHEYEETEWEKKDLERRVKTDLEICKSRLALPEEIEMRKLQQAELAARVKTCEAQTIWMTDGMARNKDEAERLAAHRAKCEIAWDRQSAALERIAGALEKRNR